MLLKGLLGKVSASLILTVIGASSAYAETRFQIKCHVELVGGGDAIYFAAIPHTDLNKAEKSLVGNLVPLAGFETDRQVFKVSECVELKDMFIDGRAQQVDSATLR